VLMTVSQLGSMAMAARQPGVSQPAVSEVSRSDPAGANKPDVLPSWTCGSRPAFPTRGCFLEHR
jgi:hypothetical protein